MRDPLEAVKEGWIGGDISFISTVEWVQELRETLVYLHKVAHAKTAYDVWSKVRSFEPGDLVLCHIPGLTGKLVNVGCPL